MYYRVALHSLLHLYRHLACMLILLPVLYPLSHLSLPKEAAFT